MTHHGCATAKRWRSASARRAYSVARESSSPVAIDNQVRIPLASSSGTSARARDGGHTLIAGLREFREHLGGELHITLLRGIGNSFEVSEMDEQLILASINDLAKLRPANVGR